MRLGRRQLLMLNWLARSATTGENFDTPWGPVEDNRVRQSLLNRGLLTKVSEATPVGTVEAYVLTAAGLSIGVKALEQTLFGNEET